MCNVSYNALCSKCPPLGKNTCFSKIGEKGSLNNVHLVILGSLNLMLKSDPDEATAIHDWVLRRAKVACALREDGGGIISHTYYLQQH